MNGLASAVIIWTFYFSILFVYFLLQCLWTFCDSICKKAYVHVFINSVLCVLCTLHVRSRNFHCMPVYMFLYKCVFKCALMALADMASCLVRLITPLSAALGSMGWWIPQQRISWLGTLHSQWLITDAVGFWLCYIEEKERDSLCMYLSELDSLLNKTMIIYCTDPVNEAWTWENLTQTELVFKEEVAMYAHFAC